MGLIPHIDHHRRISITTTTTVCCNCFCIHITMLQPTQPTTTSIPYYYTTSKTKKKLLKKEKLWHSSLFLLFSILWALLWWAGAELIKKTIIVEKKKLFVITFWYSNSIQLPILMYSINFHVFGFIGKTIFSSQVRYQNRINLCTGCNFTSQSCHIITKIFNSILIY